MNNLQTVIAAGTAWLTACPLVDQFALIGSALYVPAAEVNDVDFAVLLAPGKNAFEAELWFVDEDGWARCGEYDTTAAAAWCSVRKGEFNLMLTSSLEFFEGYKRAMEVCKALDLRNKADRIVVCQIVRDGMTADQVRPRYTPAELPPAILAGLPRPATC